MLQLNIYFIMKKHNSNVSSSHYIMDDIKITQRKFVNELENVNNKLNTFKSRLKIVFLAVKYLFTGKGFFLTTPVTIKINTENCLTIEYWSKSPDEKFKHYVITYNGVDKPVGYCDGELII